MGRQTTEMLKGILEGIVLATLAPRPAHGYDLTANLRERGFTELAEGTVYALLTRLENRGFVEAQKVPSEKGPPRKVYSLTASGSEQLQEFWQDWEWLAAHVADLRTTPPADLPPASDPTRATDPTHTRQTESQE